MEGEHAISPCAASVAALKTARITAREALTFAAVQLFVERAATTLDGFGLTDADAPAVVGICRKLDGMPLAIELATSRIDVLGISGLLTRLGDRLRLLSHGRRTARSRHRTLNATLAWSYDLLEAEEQVVLRRLAVFTGPFTWPPPIRHGLQWASGLRGHRSRREPGHESLSSPP